MRILYIIPSFQHPQVRGPTRHYHFIRELSARHSITLLTLQRSEVQQEARDELASYTDRVLLFEVNGLARRDSDGEEVVTWVPGRRLRQRVHVRDGVKRLRDALRDLAQTSAFDVMVFHGKSLFSAIKDFDGLPIVLDFCDATSLRVRARMRQARLGQRALLLMQYLQVRSVEKRLLRKTPHVAFISCRDRDAILDGDRQAEIIPNGIDLEYWTRRGHGPQGISIVFTGVMDYGPNDDAAQYLVERIVPRVLQSVPDLEVTIVGRDPSPALLAKARRLGCVTVTGYVPDMRPHLQRATVFAAPLRYASGMQNKIQEALAMQVPVVTTPIVADGLKIDGEESPPVLVAEAEGHFVECLVGLLRRADERRRLATEGRRFAERHFNWSRSAKKLESMCYRAVGREPPAGLTANAKPC